MEEEKEKWKDVVGYEGYYMVSNLGRVRSLHGKNGVAIMRQRANRKYRSIRLKVNKLGKDYFVHRLVAQAFIPNPEGLPEINHKDENPHNNRADNLEWCTRSYNIKYGTRLARYSATMRGREKSPETIEKLRASTTRYFANEDNRRKFREIMQSPEHRLKESLAHRGMHLSDSAKEKLRKANRRHVRCVETGAEYASIKEAGTALGIDRSSIVKCCSGKYKTAGGYTWQYV